jgi:hypothetical protein
MMSNGGNKPNKFPQSNSKGPISFDTQVDQHRAQDTEHQVIEQDNAVILKY